MKSLGYYKRSRCREAKSWRVEVSEGSGAVVVSSVAARGHARQGLFVRSLFSSVYRRLPLPQFQRQCVMCYIGC